jgi:hypothetical protein
VATLFVISEPKQECRRQGKGEEKQSLQPSLGVKDQKAQGEQGESEVVNPPQRRRRAAWQIFYATRKRLQLSIMLCDHASLARSCQTLYATCQSLKLPIMLCHPASLA